MPVCSAYYNDDTSGSDAIALVPVDKLEVWETSRIYAAGLLIIWNAARRSILSVATEKSFSQRLIGSGSSSPIMKARPTRRTRHILQHRCWIYQQLNLPPFTQTAAGRTARKLAKSTVCAALAKISAAPKMVVVLTFCRKQGWRSIPQGQSGAQDRG